MAPFLLGSYCNTQRAPRHGRYPLAMLTTEPVYLCDYTRKALGKDAIAISTFGKLVVGNKLYEISIDLTEEYVDSEIHPFIHFIAEYGIVTERDLNADRARLILETEELQVREEKEPQKEIAASTPEEKPVEIIHLRMTERDLKQLRYDVSRVVSQPVDPEWTKNVKYRCLSDSVIVGQWTTHAINRHPDLPHGGHLSWELVGMPSGVEPENCPLCTVPFATRKKMLYHILRGCPVDPKRTGKKVVFDV